MSELWLRVGIVAGGCLAVALVVVLMRRYPAGRPLRSMGGLAPGIYLFTSSTCADCLPARERLREKLGPGGFKEIVWEQDPDSFDRAGIVVVPCTVVVGMDGLAKSYPGVPDEDHWRPDTA